MVDIDVIKTQGLSALYIVKHNSPTVLENMRYYSPVAYNTLKEHMRKYAELLEQSR